MDELNPYQSPLSDAFNALRRSRPFPRWTTAFYLCAAFSPIAIGVGFNGIAYPARVAMFTATLVTASFFLALVLAIIRRLFSPMSFKDLYRHYLFALNLVLGCFFLAIAALGLLVELDDLYGIMPAGF
jgi:hypothetical protein